MSISEQFIKFIFTSDPSIKLDHAGYNGCAVGKFTLAHYVELAASDVADKIAADTEFFNDHNRYMSALIEDIAQLLGNIDDSRLMTAEAPTMGKLVEFINEEYPSIAALAYD